MALFNFGKKNDETQKAPTCSCGTQTTAEASCCCGTTPAPTACCNTDGKTVIKVLGSGCKSCHALYENAQAAVDGTQIEVQYITDMPTIMNYGVMSMPALVVNEQVVSMGKVLKPEDIRKLIAR